MKCDADKTLKSERSIYTQGVRTTVCVALLGVIVARSVPFGMKSGWRCGKSGAMKVVFLLGSKLVSVTFSGSFTMVHRFARLYYKTNFRFGALPL